METSTKLTTPSDEAFCSIERTLGIVGDRWSFLILREALINGLTRFGEFEDALKVAPNILSTRLARMSESGVLEKREYREAGSRPRMSYHPTPAGMQLGVVLGALQQWGDDFVPRSTGITQNRETKRGHKPVRVGFVKDTKALVDVNDILWERTAAYPSGN